MGSVFTAALCLITLFTFVSCAGINRTVAEESVDKRSPPADERVNSNKVVNRQFVGQKY